MNDDQPSGKRPAVSEQDISYLTLLKTLKRAGGAGGGSDLAVVERIAAWIDSVRVLKYICAEPRWFDDWDVKEALLHNDLCPPEAQAEIEKAIAIFDLLRELDAPEPRGLEGRRRFATERLQNVKAPEEQLVAGRDRHAKAGAHELRGG